MKEIQLREAKAFADLLLAIPPLDPEDLPKREPARVVRKSGINLDASFDSAGTDSVIERLQPITS